MKIVVIPETDEEKSRFVIAEHENVTEFLLFGNKVVPDRGDVDFHDWRGSYRYLLGSISWFEEELKEERRKELQRVDDFKKSPPTPVVQPPVTKNVKKQNVEPVVLENEDEAPSVVMEESDQV